MKTGSHWIVAVLLALTMQGESADSAAQAARHESPHPVKGQVELVEIPQPGLSGVDPRVQEQIRSAQAALASTLAEPNSSDAQKSEAFGRLGQTYQAYGFDDAALASYENAAKFAPQSFRWPYYAGFLQQRSGDTESALRSYERAHTLRPANRCVMLRLGNLEFAANHLDQAHSWFLKAVSLKSVSQPNPPAAALAGLGKVALAEHQYPAALKYFEESLAREPQASSIHYQLAMTYRALGDIQKMQEQLQARGEVEPAIQDPLLDEIDALKQGKVGLLEVATKAMHENRFADAAAAYRKMTNLDPSDAIAYRYLGVALAQSGKFDEALQEYAHALQLDPKNAPVHFSMGILLIETGKEESAITHFREAIRLDPGLVAPHFQLANLLMRAGKDEEAGREYGTVATLEPQNGFARLMEAMAAIHGGAYARGRSLLEEASAAFPDDPDIANALARLLAAAPDPVVRNATQAVRIIEPLVQSQRGDGFEEGVTLAMALAAVGRFQEAVAYQKAIIEELDSQELESQKLESSGKVALARLLRQNLDLYEHGKPCRIPWAKDDPVFSPVSSKIQLSSP
ncbi:MAG: tetratricopeptide repeat protein [Candidatus Sulfotelmatobacter sp.]